MAGWLPVHRAPRERQAAPLRGYKLAHPMVSADGTRDLLAAGANIVNDVSAMRYSAGMAAVVANRRTVRSHRARLTPSVCVTQTQWHFHRMPLLRLTRRTSK